MMKKDKNDNENVIFYSTSNYKAKFERIFYLIIIALLIYFFENNPTFFSIIIGVMVFLFLQTATEELFIFQDSLKFKIKWLIPLFNKEYCYYFNEINDYKVEKEKEGLLDIILTGIWAYSEKTITIISKSGQVNEFIKVGIKWKDLLKSQEIVKKNISF